MLGPYKDRFEEPAVLFSGLAPGKTGRDADNRTHREARARANLRQSGRPPRQTYIQDQIRRGGRSMLARLQRQI